MQTISRNHFVEIASVLTLVAIGCETPAPTASTALAPKFEGLSQPLQQVTDEPEPVSDDGVTPEGFPTCVVIDVQQVRVERVEGLYATLRILADTTAEGELYARVWLNERHTVRVGDFDLERGELTFFTVLLPPPGPPVRLFVDVELVDPDGSLIQCDRSLMVDV